MTNNVMFGIGVGILLFMSFAMILGFVIDDLTVVIAPDKLNCNNAGDISDGNKLTCLVIQSIIPYIFITVLSVIGGTVAGKLR